MSWTNFFLYCSEPVLPKLLYSTCQYKLIYLCRLSFEGHREIPITGHKGVCSVYSGHINLCQINKEEKKDQMTEKKDQMTENDRVICSTLLTSGLFLISCKIIACNLYHGNWVSMARYILNALFIHDNILSRLLIFVQKKSASESEMLVSSGSFQTYISKDLVIHVNQITGLKMKLWESRYVC